MDGRALSDAGEQVLLVDIADQGGREAGVADGADAVAALQAQGAGQERPAADVALPVLLFDIRAAEAAHAVPHAHGRLTLLLGGAYTGAVPASLSSRKRRRRY